MKKIFRSFFNVVVIIFIIYSIITFSQRNTVFITTRIDSSFLTGEKVYLHVDTNKGNKPLNPDSMFITIYNKYNKNEIIETELETFEDGKAFLLFSPRYAGEYIVDIDMEANGESHSYSTSFKLK